jgi:hypothetical protein
MTKRQALTLFMEGELHNTKQLPDAPARRVNWNKFVIMLEKDGRITGHQAFIWNNPF